jgi:hypothetical protein
MDSRSQKPPNGQAQSNSYLLVFDLDDEGQAKAWDVAQQLAAQRKLKHVLVGMLLAVHTVQEHTGRQIDMTEFMAQFVTNMVIGGRGLPVLRDDTQPDELPSMFAGTEDRADPLEARQAFAGGMGNLFDAEDDWDV